MDGISKRIVYILSAVSFLMAAGYTMLVPFLPVYLLELGVAREYVAMWSGLVFSSTFFIAGIMAPIWGKLADKKGRKRMVIRAGIALAICNVLTGMVQNEWQLVFMRAMNGFANGFVPASMTLLSLSVSKHEVGPALNKFQMGLILGNVVGPFLGGSISHLVGMRPVFYIVGALFTIATVVVYKWIPEPTRIEEDKEEDKSNSSIWKDIKEVRHNTAFSILLVAMFVAQGALLMIQPIFPLYIGQFLESVDSAAMTAGAILSTGGIVAVCLAPWWGKFGQEKGYFTAIFVCILGSGIMVFLQGLAPTLWFFAISQVVLSMFGVGTMPSINAAVAEHTPAATRGRAFGMTTMAQQFGNMVGPLVASLISTYVGFSAVFYSTSLVLLTVALWIRRQSTKLMYKTK